MMNQTRTTGVTAWLPANFATHPQVLAVMAEPDGATAMWVYICRLAHAAGDNSAERVVSPAELTRHGGDEASAALLVKHGLWTETPGGWLDHYGPGTPGLLLPADFDPNNP